MSVSKLRELLGDNVLLLAWPSGSKGNRTKWGNLTIASMTPAYLKKLEYGNIGVALGKVSSDLVALDVDDDTLVEPYLALNPWLKDTLQTHGRRARVFWLRMTGDYPAKTVKLKTQSGGDAGEWRAGKNTQSIIHGIHPDTGKPYQILNKVKPLGVDFTSIIWPSEISNPPKLETELLASVTERRSNRVTELQSNGETDVTDETDAIGCAPPLVGTSNSDSSIAQTINVDYSKLSIADAVALALPNGVHQSNGRLFILGRAIKRIESNSGEAFTPAKLREVFAEWHRRALPFLRREQTRDDYLIQFMNAYQSAIIPLGEDGVKMAWKRAQENPLPPEAIEHFEDAAKRLLVALCWELQIIHGPQPFFLSARTVQQLFGLASHMEAARWLRSLRGFKILEEVEKGSGVRASRYRWIAQTQLEKSLP